MSSGHRLIISFGHSQPDVIRGLTKTQVTPCGRGDKVVYGGIKSRRRPEGRVGWVVNPRRSKTVEGEGVEGEPEEEVVEVRNQSGEDAFMKDSLLYTRVW